MITFITRWAALGALLTAATLPVPALAQVWTANGCSGCHGNPIPPDIAASVTDGSNSVVLGLGEGWMASSAALKTRANTAGAAAAMTNLTQVDADAVWAYFVLVRDAALSTPAINFSNTRVGQSSSTSFSFTISNYRNQALTYTLGRTGTAAADYAITAHTVSGAGCSVGNVPATATTSASVCTVNVTMSFAPSATGTRTANLAVNLAGASNPQPLNRAFALGGVGTAPGYSASTGSLSFTTKVGTSTTNSFTITNTGTASLNFSSFSFSSASFVRSGSSSCSTAAPVTAGNSCTLVVSFTAPGAGATNGTLTINHDASGSPDTLTLNGTGTLAAVTASSTTLAFGSSQLGVPKALPAITVTNSGSASLVFATDPTSAGARSGADAGDFSIASTCSTGSPLGVGASCTITGTFTPSALGARGATLTVASDASNSPLVVSLAGSGVALPEPVVTYPATDFPDTAIGDTSAQTRQIVIGNSRTRNISYSLVAPTDFPIAAESCAGRVVPGGGGSCTITLRFQPTLGSGEGQRSASVPLTFAGTLGDVAPGSVTGNVAGKALLPLLLSATSLNPAAVVGTPTTVSALLTNRASAALTLSDLVFSGTQAADYSLDAANTCAKTSSLSAGASCTLVIRFNPAAAGVRSATLTLTHTAAGSPQTITLNGSATPAPQGQIALGALSIAYADTQLGSSVPQSVTVQNVGNLALNFSAFTVAGTHPADFSRSGDCSATTPLAINASCTLTVTFTPAALGLRSASLTITSDASNGPVTLALSGQGVPVPVPLVTFAPTTLDFGDQTLGGLYPTRVVRLSNTGTADLSGIVVALQGAGFATATACAPTLAAGASCDIAIGFGPIAANTDYNGTLQVTSNAAGSPHSVALHGRGTAATVPVLLWQPVVAQLDFGNVAAGTVSASQTATLVNQGPGGVTFTLLNTVGVDAAAFAVTGGTCAAGQTLFQGQTCTVTIGFAPSAAGTRSAAVQVASSGSFPPTLALTGVGLGGPVPTLGLSATALAFEATRVGSQSLPTELLLSSSGSGSLRITGLEVSGPYTMQVKTCPALPFTLTAGSACSVTVSFQPQAEGSATGALRVTSDAAPVASEVALSGTGQAKADVSGGGCSIAAGETLFDPTLWALLFAAALILTWRARGRRR